MDKDALIAYISKLNERNIQRQQASGFTLWAIVGVLAFLILDLIDKIVEVYSSDLESYLIIILSGPSILCFSVILLVTSLSISSSSSGVRRFYSTIEKQSFLMVYVPICSVVLIFSFINFKAATLATKINIPQWIFWSFFIFFAVVGLFPFINKLYQIRKSSKVKMPYPELNIFSRRMKLISSFIYATLSIAFLLALYLTFQSVSLTLKYNQISLLIKTSIEILGFYIFLVVFFLNIGSSNRYSWLENLESEIYLNDLSESEIRERLEREYIGIDIFKWISKSQEKVSIAANKLLNSLKEEKPKLEEIKKIDETFKT